MKYKVLQRFITKTNVYTPGDIYQTDTPGKFTNRLIEYGFIEKMAEDNKFARWEEDGIVSGLANVIIAPEDYIETDKKEFTYDEARELEKSLPDGWRLPTRKEWVLICEEFGWNEETKDLDANLLAKKLKIKYALGTYVRYWSRTAYSGTLAYLLYLYSSGDLYPAVNGSRYLGLSVRLVKEVE